MSQLLKINPQQQVLPHDVVFVHGLDGDSLTSWTEAKKIEESWLSWLAADLPDVSVWSLNYDIKALSWRAHTMPLQDRGTNILELLLSNNLGTRPMAFVCHSYGGLLVKQMLRNGSDSNEPTKVRLVGNTQGVIFLATPHAGSDKATWFTSYANILSPSVAIAELQAQSASLRGLNLWYRNNAEKLGIATAVLFETKPTKGIQIVDQASADPGILGVTPIPVDTNHVDICKPKSRKAEVYLHVLRHLRNWFSPDLAMVKGPPAIFASIDWGSVSPPPEDLRKLTVSVASGAFPDGDSAFPRGSLLSRKDGAVSFALRKPSVALRAAIEFMQGWHAFVLKGKPDCRAIIVEGAIKDANNWRLEEVNETFFHELATGCIYVSEAIADAADPTMAAFTLVGQSNKSALRLFRVEFEDPRTLRDSSLIHAFFVAHPAAQSVRIRLIELFLVEYMMENGSLIAIDHFETWLDQHHYPALSPAMVVDTLASSEYFYRPAEASFAYALRAETREDIEAERISYTRSQTECIELVKTSLREVTDSEAPVELTNLLPLVDEYLSAVFFEIRLMANYLRRTDQVFESSTQTLRKFDHIINRRLKGLSEGATDIWRTSFIRGLKRAAELKNAYVATIFHNVLATYYLNRSQRTARYQRDRLKGRTLYVDTNVLYAARVGASSHHEISMYLLAQLGDLGFGLRVFPFSIREYEDSLRSVDRAFHNGVPEPWVIENNPWIYQEFRLNHSAYFTFSACREVHSISKAETFSEVDFDRMDEELAPLGIKIERNFQSLDDDAIPGLWQELISKMGSNSWEMDRWLEFRHVAISKGEKAVEHDVLFIHNVVAKSEAAGTDEFGPRALLLTLDAEHLLRLRRSYPFIVGIRQCQQYFLPYLFLNDTPIKQSVEFPNQLLSAQLGMLLMKYRPTAIDIVESALRSQKPLQLLESAKLPYVYRDVARSLNQERFREIINTAAASPEQAAGAAVGLADLLEFGRRESLGNEYTTRAKDEEIVRLRAELDREREDSARKGKALEKQRRTNRYLRSQARKKK